MKHLQQQPQIGSHVYQHDSSVLIGDVHIGDHVSIWPQVVMRGDVHRIEVGHGTNIQDHSILHVTHRSECNPDGFPCILGDGITVGHRVTLHGCICESHCFIGMHCLIMDGAVIESGAYLGAGCLVPPGKRLEGGYLYLGQPAKAVRPLTPEEKDFIAYSAQHYQQLKDQYLHEGVSVTIYFIMGASGSGKSAIRPHLEQALKQKDVAIFDFDEIGVPPDADQQWRQQSTETWIERLLGMDEGTIILLGQMVPGEIMAAKAAADIQRFYCIFLDCEDAVRMGRLNHPDYQHNRNQSTLNWASWLRMHCVDPQWEQGTIKNHSIDSMNFARWDHLKYWDELATFTTIDTSHMDVDDTAEMVLNIMKNDIIAHGNQVAYDRVANIWQRERRWQNERAYVDQTIGYLTKHAEPRKRKVLDVGCGSGKPIGEYLIEKGFNVYGMDISEGLLRHARKVFAPKHVWQGDIRYADLRGTYDGIVCWLTLQHIHADEQAWVIDKFYHALNPNGVLLISMYDLSHTPKTFSKIDQHTMQIPLFNELFYHCGQELEDNVNLLLHADFEILKMHFDPAGHVVMIAKRS